METSRSFLKPVLVVGAVVLVPVVPFLILGASFEARVRDWIQSEVSPLTQALAVAGALAADIFLPIPSSAVITYAGGVIGFAATVVASWLGLTAGCVVGFGLARWFGQSFATRFSSQQDLSVLRHSVDRYGPIALLVTRPLPILAEACVLLTGTTRLPWTRFVAPIAVGNAIVSVVYAACGALLTESDSLIPVTILSGTIPLAAALFARRWLWKKHRTDV
jgi:uncharacterized membrane protein YdjX (TVP38/TMEM64 family)